MKQLAPEIFFTTEKVSSDITATGVGECHLYFFHSVLVAAENKKDNVLYLAHSPLPHSFADGALMIPYPQVAKHYNELHQNQIIGKCLKTIIIRRMNHDKLCRMAQNLAYRFLPNPAMKAA